MVFQGPFEVKVHICHQYCGQESVSREVIAPRRVPANMILLFEYGIILISDDLSLYPKISVYLDSHYKSFFLQQMAIYTEIQNGSISRQVLKSNNYIIMFQV